jgi:hypothetical protein
MRRKPTPKPPDGPRYLTAKQVAERYGQKLRWVYNCTTLPRRKVGRKLVFREDELLEFEMTWKRATPSFRTFQTMKELGKTASDNSNNCWVNKPEGKPRKRSAKLKNYLKFDME